MLNIQQHFVTQWMQATRTREWHLNGRIVIIAAAPQRSTVTEKEHLFLRLDGSSWLRWPNKKRTDSVVESGRHG